MNYLGHFALNHDIRALPETPEFVMGVALPDLWPRFSRRKRIRWPAVRAAAPSGAAEAALRAGLLNHVEADASFHSSGAFLRVQSAVRGNLPPNAAAGFVLDFVAHIAVELALDHHLVCEQPDRAERFYAALECCDAALIENHVGSLGQVDSGGLAREITAFIARRFAPRYRDRDTLVGVLEYILSLTRAPAPPREILANAVDAAIDRVDPDPIWRDLAGNAPAAPSPRRNAGPALPCPA